MSMSMTKLTGTMIAAYMPKARIGRISEIAFAKNATAVVDEVTSIELNERLKA